MYILTSTEIEQLHKDVDLIMNHLTKNICPKLRETVTVHFGPKTVNPNGLDNKACAKFTMDVAPTGDIIGRENGGNQRCITCRGILSELGEDIKVSDNAANEFCFYLVTNWSCGEKVSFYFSTAIETQKDTVDRIMNFVL